MPPLRLQRRLIQLRQLGAQLLIHPIQPERVDQESENRGRNAPQRDMQRLGLNAAGLQHKVVHEDDRAEGHEDIFAEEQPDVVGRGRHGAQTVAGALRQLAVAVFRCPFRHRRQQRPHHLRMPAQAGQPHRRGNLAHEQVYDQQTAGGGAFDLGDPRLRTLFQPVALQQADHRQRQQQDQRQVTGVEKALAELFQNDVQRHQRRQTGDDAGGDHHQHRVETQYKPDHDGGDANQWPEIHGLFHSLPSIFSNSFLLVMLCLALLLYCSALTRMPC